MFGKKIKVICMSGLLIILSLMCWFHKTQDYSDSERRKLEGFPTASVANIWNGIWMEKFELYTQDQFPKRESFRKLKALLTFYGLRQKDVHDIYIMNGSAAKIEDQLHLDSIQYAAGLFQKVYEKYLADRDMKFYAAVVPDKSFYMAETGGYPHLDYGQMYDEIANEMSFAEMIDLREQLSMEDYYQTDSHWRQEKIVSVADLLAMTMTKQHISDHYMQTIASDSFYGVYYGQAALPLKPDCIIGMEDDYTASANVYNYETDQWNGIYDTQKVNGRDPYEYYLSGASAMMRIETKASGDKKLIVFRDSFASSLIPYMTGIYSEILLIDLRYIKSTYLGQWVDFDNWQGADVLFIQSTTLWNQSNIMH